MPSEGVAEQGMKEMKGLTFTIDEKKTAIELARRLDGSVGELINGNDRSNVLRHIKAAISGNAVERDAFGLNPIVSSLQTAAIAVEEIGLKRDGVLAILLYPVVQDYDEIKQTFGENVARIIHGLGKIQELYKKSPVIESENFRNLLLSFAEDMRVILIMIADRVNLMRQIRDTENVEAKTEVSEEASYLYAPLAHKLGLYKLKSELEDLSLKYLEHDA